MKITEQEFRQLLDKYLTGQASEEDVKLLDNFFESYLPAGARDGIDPHTRDEILDKILGRIVTDERFAFGTRKTWLTVAASLALVAVAAYFFLNSFQFKTKEKVSETQILVTDSTSPGEKLLVELPDGSKVHLNSKSRITYPKKFTSSLREVRLKGEAFFEVVHEAGKPFVVKTNNADTRVLGTAFNVRAFEGERNEITLLTGKVNVISPAGDSVFLSPSEQAVVESSSYGITKRQVDVLKFVSWKDNMLLFEKITLKDAAKILEDWYGVKIEIENPQIEKCVITAKYEDESLENVLKSLQFLLKIQYSIEQGQVKINGKGC